MESDKLHAMNIDIVALTHEHLEDAAQLFCQEYVKLRTEGPALSDVMTNPLAARQFRIVQSGGSNLLDALLHTRVLVALTNAGELRSGGEGE